MKQRFWIIMGLVVLFFIGLIIMGASSGNQRSSSAQQQGRTRATHKFTIYSAPQVTSIMIDYILYVNENYANETAKIFYNDLPASFFFGENEVLSFTVVTQSGYTLNYWLPDDGRPYHDNPLHYQTSGDFTLTVWIMREK